MSIMTWVIWSLFAAAFSCANAVNRRALQSRSWLWNAWSTLTVGILYVGTIVGVGNEILTGSHKAIVLAALIYGGASALGSVIGQELVLQLSFFQRIEHRDE